MTGSCGPVFPEYAFHFNGGLSVVRGSREKRELGYRRAAEDMNSWLDHLHLDPQLRTDMRRIKWNPDATLPFFDEKACGFDVHTTNSVRDHEQREERFDRNWWKNGWDVAEVKRYFSVLFPGFKQAAGDRDKAINDLFEQLKQCMGGDGKIHKFTWPAVLLLATKK